MDEKAVVTLTAEQTGGPKLVIRDALVLETVLDAVDGTHFRTRDQFICRVSDIEREFGYKHRGGSTAREQASLVLLGLCAELRCFKRG